ncbi:uncharacterized protein K02A2.6-like [Episyrphus balteatus]|uniref:uncharacterized protein K02A2.6-like n=1 Tax=Episyrphus balteatus TaxID=286459 RepID=UPI002486A153|nr:uncharacterized protein K02A2.6-like [Episyrphus balteatus]
MSSRLVGHIEPFVPGANFKAYEDRIHQFFIVNDLQEEAKTPFFITIVGAEIYEVLMSLTMPDLPSSKDFSTLMTLLRNHFSPKKNKRAERYAFYKAKQEEGEPINDFIVRLKSLAQTCEFGGFLKTKTTDKMVADHMLQILDENLTDRFIIGLRDEKIQQVLLNDDSLTFEKYCEKALNMELSQKTSRSLQAVPQQAIYRQQRNNYFNRQSHQNAARKNNSHTPSAQSNHPSQSSHSHQSSQSNRRFESNHPSCYRCGRNHNPNTCPAKNWECFLCHAKGHTSTFCKKKNRNQVNAVNTLDTEAMSINTIESSDTCAQGPLQCELLVNGQPVTMEIDTGATESILSEAEFILRFPKAKLNNIVNNLCSVTGSIIKELGSMNAEVSLGVEKFVLKLIVIEGQWPKKPLLGRTWLDTLFPNWRQHFCFEKRIQTVSNNYLNVVSEIKQKFPGILNKNLTSPIVGFTASVVLKENSSPIFHAAYNVPYKLREKVEAELIKMCNDKVIEPIEYSRWASPVVVVPKTIGDIRLCVDFKVTINKFIETAFYPLPNPQDIYANLANCSVFCVIDLTGAYQQLAVDPACQDLLVINTLKGLYRCLRLPLGVASGPAIFQSVMDLVLLGFKNVFCYIDDILIGGASEGECKKTLFEVLARLDKHNIRINIDKCKFLEESVAYLVHNISVRGITPKDDKVKAISEAPAPQNITQLQSFLGLINYYGKFIPHLSTKLKPLYNLLRKDVEFCWSVEAQNAFQNCKKLLLTNNILELFDPSKPIIVATDASPYGVGAVLSHIVNGVEKPVIFASSTLSESEKHYSQLHREALAIVFAVKKFHNYLYGQKFVIYTDHQALREIFNPNKGTPPVAASRLQRWAVILSMYLYTISYKRGSLMSNADGLSRLPIKESTDVEPVGINFFSSEKDFFLQPSLIKEHLVHDDVLNSVYSFLMGGWPKQIPQSCLAFFKIKNTLSTDDGCIYRGNRIVLPNCLVNSCLKILHTNHTGIERMKMIARSYVWWINCDKDIENFSKSCEICQKTQNVKREIVTTKWPQTNSPLERVHIDFFYFSGKSFLIIIDSYSKYCEIKYMKNTTAENTISQLEDFFVIFGFPVEIVCDNGPPFGSFKFQNYCSKFKIKLTHSPPYHPSQMDLLNVPYKMLKKF